MVTSLGIFLLASTVLYTNILRKKMLHAKLEMDEKIFLQCPQCLNVYELIYFLNLNVMDECVFCYCKGLKARI